MRSNARTRRKIGAKFDQATTNSIRRGYFARWRENFVTQVTQFGSTLIPLWRPTALRQFRDSQGVEWQVFRTSRGTNPVVRDRHLPIEFREGWLVFQSATEKRRLAPAPENWESLSPAELESLLPRAVPNVVRSQQTRAASDRLA